MEKRYITFFAIFLLATAVSFQVGCGLASEDVGYEAGDRTEINPTQIVWVEKWKTKWAYVGCSFKLTLDTLLPGEYAHYMNTDHLFSIHYGSNSKSTLVKTDKMEIMVPCYVCGYKEFYGTIEAIDNQYGDRFWGCGDVQPPLYPKLVTSKFEDESYTFTPETSSLRDLCRGDVIAVKFKESCTVLTKSFGWQP